MARTKSVIAESGTDSGAKNEEHALAEDRGRRWGWLTVPVLILGFFIYDFGLSLLEFRHRTEQVKAAAPAGRDVKKVYNELADKRFVMGLDRALDDPYRHPQIAYVETKLRRPLTLRWIIRVAQGLGWARSPYNRLLPMEQVHVNFDTSGKAKIEARFDWWPDYLFEGYF